MPRDLRPRRTRQSYTTLFHSEGEEENEPGPSQRRRPSIRQEDDSGSDFAPPAPGEATRDDEEGSDDGVEDNVDVGIDSSSNGFDMNIPTKTPRSKKGGDGTKSQGKDKKTKRKKDSTTTKAKGKQKEKAQVTRASVPATNTATSTTALPPAQPTSRQNYALPNPNVHHRHRPVPLFPGPTAPPGSTASGPGSVRVERLQRAPRLFAPNETLPTYAYASTAVPLITRRVGRAWGASVGAGPVWEIVEDLGWFRESTYGGEAQAQVRARALREKTGEEGAAQIQQGQGQGQVVLCEERARRPRVHDDVILPEGWTVFRRAECVSSLFLPFLADSPWLRPLFPNKLLMSLYQRRDRLHADGWRRGYKS
jgi:transcription factor C subunit 6